MNTVFRQTVLLGFIAATSAAMADGWVLFKDGDWRVSAGPVFDSGVKTRLRCDPHASFSVPYAAGLTAAEAERLAREGTPVSGTRRKYASGAWIDTDDDTTYIFGHTPVAAFGPDYEDRMLRTDTWIDIDTGASYGHSPMLLRLDDEKAFYIDK